MNLTRQNPHGKHTVISSQVIFVSLQTANICSAKTLYIIHSVFLCTNICTILTKRGGLNPNIFLKHLSQLSCPHFAPHF